MKILRSTSVLIALAAAALVAGCGPEDYDYPHHPGYPGPRHGSYDRSGDVEGTVVRVGRRDHVIVVDRGDTGDRYGGGYRRNGRDEVPLFYDDDTTVEYQGRTYRPEDLEPGDRIQASVEPEGDRLIARDIEVLYDVSSGTRDDSGYQGDRNDSGYRGDRNDRGDRGDRSMTELRGTVRKVDPRDHTLELELATDDPNFSSSDPRSNVILVHYDARTSVQYQDRNYAPEGLEQGDVVEIRLRHGRGLPIADQIRVVEEGPRSRSQMPSSSEPRISSSPATTSDQNPRLPVLPGR
jgi:hypothetical protein